MSEQTPQRSQHPPGGATTIAPSPRPTAMAAAIRIPATSRIRAETVSRSEAGPTPCPDPCDSLPAVRSAGDPASCCTRPRLLPEAQGGEPPTCTWDEVDDPCVRASACAGRGRRSPANVSHRTPIPCKCEDWECGSYPQGTCVPCEPCRGCRRRRKHRRTAVTEPPDGKGSAARRAAPSSRPVKKASARLKEERRGDRNLKPARTARRI